MEEDDWAELTAKRRRALVKALASRHEVYRDMISALKLFLRDTAEAFAEKKKSFEEMWSQLESGIPSGDLLQFESATEGFPADRRERLRSVIDSLETFPVSIEGYPPRSKPEPLKGPILLRLEKDQVPIMGEFVNDMISVYRLHPQMMREMALVYAFALLDGLIADVLYIIMTHTPATLRSSRQITQEEALRYANRKALISALARREVIDVTRQSAASQIMHFETKYGINTFSESQELIGKLTLAAEQRNIIVHNNGLATSEYVRMSRGAVDIGSRVVIDDAGLRDHLLTLTSVADSLTRGCIDKFMARGQ